MKPILVWFGSDGYDHLIQFKVGATLLEYVTDTLSVFDEVLRTRDYGHGKALNLAKKTMKFKREVTR